MDCPEHGKQHPPIPWADADSPFTAAFEKWIGGLAESFGDPKKAAHFAGVEYVLVRRFLRRAAEEVGKAKGRPAGGNEAISRTQSRIAAGQISLFTQNMSFVNQGTRAYNNMELEKPSIFFENTAASIPRATTYPPG